MVTAVEGLVAPEGLYIPTYSYLLPPAPAYPHIPSATSLQGNAAKDAAGGAGGTSGVSSNANGSLGASSGGNVAAIVATTTVSPQALAGSVNGLSGAANGSEDESGAGDGGENDVLNTALHHISLQAPSAWSHVPLPPAAKISVASVRYLNASASSSSRRDRQQSSFASTAEVPESNNESDSSLPGADGTAAGVGNNGIQDFVAPPALGPVLEATLASQGVDGPASHVTGGAGGLPGMSALQLLAHLGGAAPLNTTAALSVGSSLTPSANAGGKSLLKPKNNLKQTSSSFVQRLQNHSEYTKLFGPRPDGNTIERFAFVSRGRVLYWLGENSHGWIKDPLARLSFASHITSHDINQVTRSPTRLDVVIGFTTGDIVWFEAITSRYSRLNKAGCINDAAITNLRWIPGSENLLISTHSDGTCTIFDISREDSSSGSWAPVRGMTFPRDGATPNAAAARNGRSREDEDEQEVMLDGQTAPKDGRIVSSNVARVSPEHVPYRPAIKHWYPVHRMLVTRPAAQEAAAEGVNKKVWLKLNPVAHWRITRSCSITDLAFSPDHTKLAIVSTDGHLRIVNLLTESLEGCFESYYGALNRVVFSPDAKFLLTAGCDDLVSVWTSDGRLLSRCPGHTSFVTGLAFDPWRWKVEDKTYRFASVGEDGKVFLWDFSSAALVRPKMPHSASSYQKRSSHGGSTFSLLQDQHQRRYSGPRRGSIESDAATSAAFARALPRGEVAELQPVASYQIGGTPLAQDMAANQSGSVPQSASMASGGTSTSAGLASNASNPGNTPGTPATSTGQAAIMNPNDPGSSNDLLVEVRFRQDGLLLVHKSGTMRFLLRPRQRAPGVRLT